MQQELQTLQYRYRIYNSDIEPEHDSDMPCACPIHEYTHKKQCRIPALQLWSKAVRYPGIYCPSHFSQANGQPTHTRREILYLHARIVQWCLESIQHSHLGIWEFPVWFLAFLPGPAYFRVLHTIPARDHFSERQTEPESNGGSQFT